MTHPGIYLFLGADRARKLQRIQEIERALRVDPLDRHEVDGATVSSSQLLALCRQRPAASPVRLIAVEQAHRLGADAIAALVHHAQTIAQAACVMLLVEVEVDARHPLAAYQRGTPPTGGEVITIERFPGRDAVAVKPFALVDALGSRDAAAALAAVHDQLVAGKDPVELFGLIAWQLQRWVAVKRLVEAGYQMERLAALTQLRPWQVERIQSEIRRRSLRSLQELLTRSWQLEADAKSGRTIPGVAIEALVLEVCGADALTRSRVG